MPHIDESVIKQAVSGIEGLLKEEQKNIEIAYCREDGTVTVRFAVKFMPVDGNVGVETNMRSITDQIKRKTFTVVDKQRDSLFKESK